MTHELILTSVAQGLNPKDNGYCPVAMDAAISPRVIENLSVLSSYRSFVSGSGKSPVAYFHIILPGGIEHVLSRVAVSGIDYQQKPNVLAHHIVLEGLELVPEGPGWLLALTGFHLSEWSPPPLRFLQGRPIPTLTNPESLTRRQLIARQSRWLDPQKMALTGSVDTESELYLASVRSNESQIILAAPPTTPCPTWKALTGDAGWGGVLAETVFSGQPVAVIYNPEQNILPLFVEALALLPPYSSWQTTFCTYYTGFPDLFPCQWKGVIAGSEEAKILSEDMNNWVLDLSLPMGNALPGRYVDYARYGQEHMLPLDAEEYAATLANADTKSYDDEALETDKLDAPPPPPQSVEIPDLVPQAVTPPKHTNPFETFLHRSSRTQFYLLYGIMFALVLFLIVLEADQIGDFGIIHALQHWNHPANPNPPKEPKGEIPSALENEAESEREIPEPGGRDDMENIRESFSAEREEQKLPLLLFWESFVFPEYLPLDFPNVEEDQVGMPVRKTFGPLSPLYPFGAALELRFIPLFEFPQMNIGTRQLLDSLPDLVWQTEAVDTETGLSVPMFHFQLTEAGLSMEWQPEGLSNQYLYETVLSSLGFLQLNVAENPETVKRIPLFAPEKPGVMKVSDLAGFGEPLPDLQPPEYTVESPFASDLWQRIFAELNPPRILRLEVWAEPMGNWVQMHSLAASEFRIEIRTAQQVGKQAEGGETFFENMVLPFTVEASLERVLWKSGDYAGRLRSEAAEAVSKKIILEETIEQLRRRVFEGDESARQERDQQDAELRALNLRLKEIEGILERLPEAYREISRNETWGFHYSVFLEPPEEDKSLLILTTVQ